MDLSKNLCFLYRKQPRFVNPLQNFVTADQFCTAQDCVTKGFPAVSASDNLLFNRQQAIPGNYSQNWLLDSILEVRFPAKTIK